MKWFMMNNVNHQKSSLLVKQTYIEYQKKQYSNNSYWDESEIFACYSLVLLVFYKS